MRLAWVAAFVLSLSCTPLSHPQQDSSPVPPPHDTSTSTKAATAQTAAADSAQTSAPDSAVAAATGPDTTSAAIDAATTPNLTEDELRQALVGKHLFLRGLWLSDDLHFGLTGTVVSQSARGSWTLCDVEIDKVRLTKRHVELEGARYGIHFEDEGNWSQQASAFDRIRVTGKKKHLLIVIDRQVIVSPKKQKKHAQRQQASHAARAQTTVATQTAPVAADAVSAQPADGATQSQAAPAQPAAPGAEPASTLPPAETTNPAASAALLRASLNRIFAPGLDASMIDAMPDYWQYFYNAQVKHQSIEPTDPNIVHPGPGVSGPTIVHNLVPPSNDYAQHAQIAGVASYKVILGADGKPIAIAVYRPIGFGLDENAVAAIQKSTFAPAMRDGKPVTSVIDMAVVFRILSPLTERASAPEAADLPPNVSPVTGKPSLPGPYSVNTVTSNQ